MNYKSIIRNIGHILRLESIILLLPLLLSFIYKEKHLYISFIIPICLLFIIGELATRLIKQKTTIYAREGFLIVAFSWFLMSIFGALPFFLSKEIPNLIDAIFESTSGFTTTGATIVNDVEALSRSLLFWRSITQWLGGMGILVFVLAFIPTTDSQSFFILKAESPGPSVGKLVSKVRLTARILYSIYIILTLLQLILLLAGGMPLFDSINYALTTAGTGGFAIKNTSIISYNNLYFEIIFTIFMILFGLNFNIFYLILIGQGIRSLKSEELRWYLGIIIISILIISINTLSIYNNIVTTLRYSSFHVASIITTTGFYSYDFNTWPTLSKWIIIFLMFSGACAGSTSGGMKVSRIAILIKNIIRETKKLLHPRQVITIKFNNKPVDKVVLNGVFSYLIAYFFIMIIGTIIISIFDNYSLITNFTAVISSLSNIGLGFDLIGPVNNYAIFSYPSKIILSLLMLAGRLEIFPILMIFFPATWKKL
ncbi:MAG TPA: TrkH family potassium uptake protein [Acholeplasmataceae bacterium]|nr:TrkH family potassium uptake protein [Acholeplasmataceae bacterium]